MAHVLTQLKIVPKTECSEAVALAKELGLELQAKRYEKPLAEEVFKELNSDEITLWSNHCPTRYFPGGERPIEQYAFDSVPIEVMRHWKKIKDNYAFDRYEIWTTEKTRSNTDPLLIGVIGKRLFLLARWGFESPENTSVEAMAREIHDRLLMADMLNWQSRLSWNVDWMFRGVEYKKKKIEEKALDWCCYHSNSRIFTACRRILGMEIPPMKYRYSSDW